MGRIWLPLVTSVLFSGSYVAGKYTTLELGPLTTTLVRYVIALAFLAALMPRFGVASLAIGRAHRRRDLVALAALGLFGIVGYHTFFFLALRHTAIANTAIINALSPVLTALAAAVVLNERLPRSAYAGVAISCVGVALLVSGASPTTLLTAGLNHGDLLMLLSVLSWIVYSLLLKHLSGRYTGYALTFYATASGVLLLVLIAPVEGPVEQLRAASATALVCAVYMGVLASGLGYLLYTYSVEAIGPTRTSSLVYGTVPVLVSLLALGFLGEPITGLMAASIVLTMLGLRLVMSRPGPAPTRR